MNSILLALILHTSQPSQVTQIVNQHESLNESRLACKFQLNDKVIPTACYSTLRLEQRLRIIESPKARALEKQLDELCKKAARLALSGEDREVPRLVPSLSTFCRKEVNAVVRILKYVRHEDNVVEHSYTL